MSPAGDAPSRFDSPVSAATFAGAPAGSAESFAFQLCTLREAGPEVLGREEYDEARADILTAVVRESSWRQWLPALGVCVLGAAAVSGYGLLSGARNFVIGGLFALVVSLVSVGAVARETVREGRLGREERLTILESLESWRLIDESEAAELRRRLERPGAG